MAQSYSSIPSSTLLTPSLPLLLGRDDAAASCFSGTAFPTANLLVGMLCYRTDQLKMYQLTATSPSATWVLIYDLSTGSMTAAIAAAVAWSGVTGKPTTLSGYGITDALAKSGDTATGKITFVVSAAGAASLTVPHGVAPSSPVNGDVWSTTAGFFARVNGNTRTFSVLEASEAYTAKKTFAASGTGAASLNVPAGAAPSSPVDGDLWATSSLLTYRMNGVSRNVVFADQLGALATLSTISTAQIAANAVDGTKIAMGSDAQGDILYYNGTDYVRLPAGTSGQFLKTNGAGANPAWATPTAGLTYLTPVNVTTGTATYPTVTGIPSTATVIYLILSPIRTSTNSSFVIRLGTSGGMAESGYVSVGSRIDAGSARANAVDGFYVHNNSNAANIHGIVQIMYMGNNKWACSYNLNGDQMVLSGSGIVTLTAAPDRVAVYNANGFSTTGVLYVAYS